MTHSQVTILGATGSIGRTAIDVISLHKKRFQIWGLSANVRVEALADLVTANGGQYVSVGVGKTDQFLNALSAQQLGVEVFEGEAGLIKLVQMPESEIVITGIIGAAGLLPTLASIKAGKRVLIANKEPLVMMGSELMRQANQSGATIMPLDSEHNAIFQCLPDSVRDSKVSPETTASKNLMHRAGIEKIILTASGGPFLDLSIEEMSHVTPEEAAAHPKWKMGKKISIDSATMMNKGLELIEACALFSLSPSQIEIVIHPQSIIHSLVEYRDASMLAQLAAPDMRIPIINGLSYPERLVSGAERLDISGVANLEFREPDEYKFPCLRLARESAECGGTAPTILNAANEIAVKAFCQNDILFNQIPEFIERTLQKIAVVSKQDLESVIDADRSARNMTEALIYG